MNTRWLMRLSSGFLGILGLVGSFIPQEVLGYLHIESSGFPVWIVQIMGALYFAFAMLNWTAKDNVMGGIYSRPIVIGNLTHFFMGALTLIKAGAPGESPAWLWVATVIYAAMAIAFTSVLFRGPSLK